MRSRQLESPAWSCVIMLLVKSFGSKHALSVVPVDEAVICPLARAPSYAVFPRMHRLELIFRSA